MAENLGRRLFTPEEAAKHFGLDMIKYEDCARWVVSQLHPSGGSCPQCSTPIVKTQHDRFNTLHQVRCTQCGKKFTGVTGTLLSTSKLEVREIYLLAVLTALGVSAARIAGTLRCHVDTVRTWQSHFEAQQQLSCKPGVVA